MLQKHCMKHRDKFLVDSVNGYSILDGANGVDMPYKELAEALQHVSDNTVLQLLCGEYEIDHIGIDKFVDIVGVGETTILKVTNDIGFNIKSPCSFALCSITFGKEGNSVAFEVNTEELILSNMWFTVHNKKATYIHANSYSGVKIISPHVEGICSSFVAAEEKADVIVSNPDIDMEYVQACLLSTSKGSIDVQGGTLNVFAGHVYSGKGCIKGTKISGSGRVLCRLYSDSIIAYSNIYQNSQISDCAVELHGGSIVDTYINSKSAGVCCKQPTTFKNSEVRSRINSLILSECGVSLYNSYIVSENVPIGYEGVCSVGTDNSLLVSLSNKDVDEHSIYYKDAHVDSRR